MDKNKLRSLLKDLLPPLIVRNLSKKFRRSDTYESYQAAMADADGYEDDILTKVVVAKGKKFSESLANGKEVDLMSLRTFLGVASAIKSNALSVIDFGGAAGTHYYLARSVISKDVSVDWRVVETPQMVKEAREQGLETNELSFYDSIESASNGEKFDLIFASGAVQCTPDPYGFLRKLTNINADKFVLTRTPVTEKHVVLLQESTLSSNGVGDIPKHLNINDKVVSCPSSMLEKSKLEDILHSFGDVTLKICEDKSAYISSEGAYDMWGYVVSRRK